jgi:hypothetical protein
MRNRRSGTGSAPTDLQLIHSFARESWSFFPPRVHTQSRFDNALRPVGRQRFMDFGGDG